MTFVISVRVPSGTATRVFDVDQLVHGRRRNMRQFYSVHAAGEGTAQNPWAIVDLSHTGARLRVKSAETVPAEFELSVGGVANRRCLVAWRSSNEIGIRFAAKE
jgi:hypothetical protein